MPGSTLTTCHPHFSAAERLIIQAELVEGPNHCLNAELVRLHGGGPEQRTCRRLWDRLPGPAPVKVVELLVLLAVLLVALFVPVRMGGDNSSTRVGRRSLGRRSAGRRAESGVRRAITIWETTPY